MELNVLDGDAVEGDGVCTRAERRPRDTTLAQEGLINNMP